jgi:tetratricopeptide (TPR) repeat protein
VTSDRTKRRIDRLLDEAEQALDQHDWNTAGDRARDVLLLDASNVDARNFLTAAERAQRSDSGDVNAPPKTDRSGAVPNDSTPTSFANGRYTVKKFLGEGGKKKVYLAHDTLLDRDVAFALIKMEGLDDTGRDRIAREAKAMGRLGAHPHIVSVYDLGDEAGQPYMVTELMAGGDVEGLIEKSPEHRPPLERTLEIGIEVCRGLEFAHSHGIVHRDLKPGNVWLTEDGRAKIGDFGLAVSLDKTRLTQAGMMVGTVSYMPPEQAMGGEVAVQSDLYSLGAMLYEMVCGRPPFIGDESVAIITQHLNAQPVAPSWHNAGVSPVLEALILQLLEKDASKRPSSARQVRDALEAIQSNAQQLAAQAPVSSPVAADNPMYRRTFVGREHELRQLQAAFDSATSGQGSLAVVVGEPGIGKTSLCEQLATYSTIRGGRALVGHCYEEGSLSLPYLPFVEAMRSYVLAREPDGLRAELGTGVGEVARIVSEIRERLHVEPSPANPADAEEERYRLFQAVSGFLSNASAVQPLVIVLEDLHDADRGTLDLLVHMARNLQGTRLLLVGTYRDVEVDRAHPLSGALAELRRGGDIPRLLLRGLTADEVQRMMSQLSGQEVPWRLAEAVHRQTEGNPLFIQEVLRYLVEEGLIKREDGRWRRASEDIPLELGIPEGLRDVIGKRLSRLSAETNTVLAMAAVMGREFRLDVLTRVAGLDDEALETALAEARSVAVVEERTAPGGAVSYRFTHAFFRQTLYEETIAPKRIRLHQQVARALEAVYGKRLEEHAAELAEHYAYSSDPADLAKAVAYGELAAQRAMSVYAYGEAERHLEQALKVQEVLDPDDKPKRCDLLLELGETMLPEEEPNRAVAVADEAFRIAENLQSPSLATRGALLGLEAIHRTLGSGAVMPPEYEEWADRADRNAESGSSERIRADCYVALAKIQQGGPVKGHVYLRRAIDAALSTEDFPSFVMAGAFGVMHLQALQDWERRQALAAEVMRRPRQAVGSGPLGALLINLGDALLQAGDRPAAEQAWSELDDIAARTRDLGVRALARSPAVSLAFLDGHLEEAVGLHQQNIELAQRSGVVAGWFEEYLTAVILVHLGEVARAEEILHDPRMNRRAGIALTAFCAAVHGQHREAQRLSESFGDVGSDEDESGLHLLQPLLEVAVLGKDVETAAALFRRLRPLADVSWNTVWPVAVGRLLGKACVLLGRPDEARDYCRRAIAASSKIGFRPELALSRLELAELLLVHYPDERVAAIEDLDYAIGEFRDMKMQPSLERALRHKDVLKA